MIYINFIARCDTIKDNNFDIGSKLRSEFIKKMKFKKEEKIKELLIKYDSNFKDKLENPIDNKVELREKIEIQIPLENPNIEYLVVDGIKIAEFYSPKFKQHENDYSHFIRGNIEYKSFV